MDLLALGGNRQRYNWFGFESAGWTYRCTISKSSVKHAMKDVDESGISLSPLNGDDPDEMAFARDLAMSQKVVCDRPAEFFMDIMRSWNSKPRLIRFRGEMAGYVSGRVSELTLADKRLLLPALKKIYLEEMSDFTISCPPHDRERLAAVSPVASGAAMTSVEMVNVLNWETTLQALLDLRASFNPLTDGRFTLQVDELPALTIEASGGKARVSRSNLTPDARFTHLEAERKLFGLDAFADGGLYGNWFPLPFWMTPMDTF